MSRGRVLVAMSGGVDSSVAAYLLLQQGYECVGATMRLAPNEDDRPGERTCCSADDVADARAACWALGIRHHVFDYTREFERSVIEPFVACYRSGGTPNPCVACNRYLKFGALLNRALELGCDYLATGHYARVERVDSVVCAGEESAETGEFSGPVSYGADVFAGRGGIASDGRLGEGARLDECETAETGERVLRYQLLTAVDASKDQSYFLSGLTQAQLAHVLLPLGGLVKKTQVRPLAEEAGLTVAHKKDSEGICFVPGGDHLRFIEEYTGIRASEGDILDTSGKVLGHHAGALRYTIGQRKGLGVAADRPLYVCATDVAANTVTLGDTADLMRSSLVASDWNWTCGDAVSAAAIAREAALGAADAPVAPLPGAAGLPAAGSPGAAGVPVVDSSLTPGIQASAGAMEVPPFRAKAKIRYRQPAQPCVATPLPSGRVRLDFDEPQRAIVPGQVAVLYAGPVVLGGGTIAEVPPR